MIPWRKNKPTADEVLDGLDRWWWTCSNFPDRDARRIEMRVRVVQGQVEYCELDDEWYPVSILASCDMYAPCENAVQAKELP